MKISQIEFLIKLLEERQNILIVSSSRAKRTLEQFNTPKNIKILEGILNEISLTNETLKELKIMQNSCCGKNCKKCK
jgi:hypothetical protein